tara:strand:- start:746 stop:1132 length:387 start_codon:yes stop_codon:yes gene_type:complete
MRSEVIEYITAAPLGRYNFSREIPYRENGVPLYLKNPLTIYVDEEDFQQQSLFRTLGTTNIDILTTTVEIVFSNDAKNTPNNYGEMVSYLIAAKNLGSGFNDTQATLSTEIVEDLQTTTVELQYTKLI